MVRPGKFPGALTLPSLLEAQTMRAGQMTRGHRASQHGGLARIQYVRGVLYNRTYRLQPRARGRWQVAGEDGWL
jgi:hypothetical protein